MRWIWTLAGSLLLLGAVACGRVSRPVVPEITSESADGFQDLLFGLEKHQVLPDGGQILIVGGVHQGRPVGFEVQLSPAWKPGAFGDTGITTYSGTVRLRSLGARSDELIRAMDALYEAKQNPEGMATEVGFSAVSLEGSPADLAAGPTSIKLFFDTGVDETYAEAYLNIDLERGRVGLDEKDFDYREALIAALARR